MIDIAPLSLEQAKWLFGIAAAALLFAFLVLSGKRRVLVAFLRFCLLCILLIALAGPGQEESASKGEIAAIVDISRSISDAAITSFAENLTRFSRDDTEIDLYAFGAKLSKSPQHLKGKTSAREIERYLQSERQSLDSGTTNIEASILAAASRVKTASVLVQTDGFETAGNARDALSSLKDAGIRLYPLISDEEAFLARGVGITSVYAPVVSAEGDAVELRATLGNSQKNQSTGKLELFVDEERIFSQNMNIMAEQEKVVVARTSPLRGGLKRVRAVFTPQSGVGTNVQERHRWISVKEKSKVLLLSGSKDDGRILRELIRDRGYALQDVVADGSSEISTSFEGISSVIFNNVARSQLPRNFLPALVDFVRAGGGLIMVGGDRSYGLGNYIDTPLEELSPVKFVPPQTEKRRLTNAFVLVIDKSGSMAYDGKMDSAKQAAYASIQALKDEDYISVIGFDAAPFVIIDVKPVRDVKLEAERRLANLTASGKTELLPALATARQRLQKAPGSRKHLIVLSDGKIPWSSEEYTSEINQLRKEGISISAVAIGVEADIPFMKMLSKYGNGAFYQTMDARELPKIFVQDIKITTGEKTMVEGEEFFVGIGPSGLQSTTVSGSFPSLKGFVETLPKKGAEFELLTKKSERIFPILASWNYGSGHVVTFTSDANGRWSQGWMRWPEFSRFWTSMIEGVKDRGTPKNIDIDFDIRYQLQGKSLVFDLSIFDEKLQTQSAPRILADVEEPGGEKRQVQFRMIKKGRFEARVEPARPGDYRLLISYGNVKLPSVAVTLEGELFGETPGKGLNLTLLEDMASGTEGKMNPPPEEVFERKRIITEKREFFPGLLLAVAALLLFEAFVRERNWFRWGGNHSRGVNIGGRNGSTKELGRYRRKTQEEKRAA